MFFVTALGAFMASLDLSIVNVAFPALERAFSHESRAGLAWVITGYSIVFGSLLVIAGRTADRLGSRRVFFAGLVDLRAGLRTLRPGAFGRAPGRRSAHPGCGAAALLPVVARSAPRRLSGRAALPGGGPVGRDRRPGRRDRPVARRRPDHRGSGGGRRST